MPKRSFGSLKPKDDKKTSNDIVKRETRLHSPGFEDYKPPEVDVKEITEEAFNLREFIDTAVDLAQPKPVKATGFIPKSECLMTTFYLLTNKSFPRKGPGKSTKIKMLDAIIMAAINKKLLLQEEKDAKSRGS